MNVNYIKMKIDIAKKNTRQKYTRSTSNKLCCNDYELIYYICETLQSNFVTKSCKTTLGANDLRASGKPYITSYVLSKH